VPNPIGVDVNDVIWVLPDVWWKRANTGEVVEAMIDMVNRRKPISWWAGKEQYHFLDWPVPL